MSVAIVAYDYSITLFPLEGEAILVLEFNPLLPFRVSELGKISEGKLDWSVFSLKLLDTGPGVKPHVMVSDRGVDNVTIETRSILKGRDIKFSFHVLFLSKVISSPGNLKTTLLRGCLSFFWAISHKGSLPVIVDRRLILTFVSCLVGQISPVAETSILEFLTQFGFHQLICHSNSIRKVGCTSHTSERMLTREGDLGARFSDVCHFMVIMKVSRFGCSCFVEVGLKLSSRIGASFILHVVHKTDLNEFFQF